MTGKNDKYVVIGGAGFIGCNAARRFQELGGRVVVLDDLSRRGAQANLDWLQAQGPLEFVKADIRRPEAMEALFRAHGDAKLVLHLAGQVAVTTSVADPRDDFERNALGTLNILEGIRRSGARPLLIYSSTNKVYGGIESIAVEERATRFAYPDYPLGIHEEINLDFHSPYGCSKGSADQYVRDYARIYGLPTTVFRQSCIYGPRQFGVEDQGWVAWFIIAAVLARPITIYGNGKQIRDLLYVDDLVDAYVMASEHPEKVSGQVYNVGGGPEFTISVWAEFGPLLEKLLGRSISVAQGPSRPGDQRIYVSDIRKIARELGWQPRTSVRAGVEHLLAWVQANRSLFTEI